MSRSLGEAAAPKTRSATEKDTILNCPNDLNAARNHPSGQGFLCELDLKKDATVMVSSGLVDGLLGSAPNSIEDIPPGGKYQFQVQPMNEKMSFRTTDLTNS